MTPELPPLPDPDVWRARGNLFSLNAIIAQGWTSEAEGVFTADQMRAYGAACAAAEREACAKIADNELSNISALACMPPKSSAAWKIAAAIRARAVSP